MTQSLSEWSDFVQKMSLGTFTDNEEVVGLLIEGRISFEVDLDLKLLVDLRA